MMSFQLPEYDQAFGHFLYQTANALARAQHPLLAEMRTETTESGASSVVDRRGGEQLDLPSELIGFEMGWDRDDVLAGNFEALLLQLDCASKELGEKLIARLVETLSSVTESTGNVVHAEGKKFSFEMLVEMLEKIAWSLDDDDELSMPSLLMHPDQTKNLPSEATPEQRAVLNDLMRRKKEELLAKRRRRRLS
jgi:hypothetical protein